MPLVANSVITHGVIARGVLLGKDAGCYSSARENECGRGSGDGTTRSTGKLHDENPSLS